MIGQKQITNLISDLNSKEVTSNKSNDIPTDAASITKFPSVKAIKDYTDGLVVGLLDDRGNYDPTITSAYPISGGSGVAGAILKGDLWYISVAGVVGIVTVEVGSSLRALVDTPAQFASNWDVLNAGLGFIPENSANKDATGGYAGLTGFALNIKNTAGAIVNILEANTTVSAKTYSLPDKSGTVAMTSDITGTNSGTNTGDETANRIATLIVGSPSKTILAGTDSFLIVDSEALNVAKEVTLTDLKTFMGSTPTVSTKTSKYLVTTLFVANEIIALSTGMGSVAGVAVPSGDYLTIALGASANAMRDNNAVNIFQNGVRQIKSTEFIWNSATSGHFFIDLELGEEFEIDFVI